MEVVTMANVSDLETKMADVFKNPKMPAGGVKAITEWAPWLSLILGVLSLIAAVLLWNGARAVDSVVNYAGSLCNAYAVDAGACANNSAAHLSVWLWLGLAVLAVEGVLYLLAYPGLKARNKQGWNYLFYGALINVVYAVVSLFTDYSAGNHFISALIGSAIGFWILFQIRGAYTGAHVEKTAPKTPVA
jgi:uncharacterized membrane protein HdeD (DUF308 family)